MTAGEQNRKHAARSREARPPAVRGGQARKRGSAGEAIDRAIGTAGQPMDAATSRQFERHFGRDFGSVRIHTGEAAAKSAADLCALAYTVGRHVVFGSGQYTPHTARGRHLLAHELAHVVQQRGVAEVVPGEPLELGPVEDSWEREARTRAAIDTQVAAVDLVPRLTRARVQRSVIGSFFSDLFSLSPGPFKAIARAFGSESYNDQELQSYLKVLQTTGKIEDRYDSDNKARAVVERWKAGKPGFTPNAQIRILLIREMATGHVSSADEHGILTILASSNHAELEQIFGRGGVDAKQLDSKFSGANAKNLHAFFATHFEGGVQAIRGGQSVLTQIIRSPYDPSNLKEVLGQRVKRIERAIAAVPAPPEGGTSPAEKAKRGASFTKKLVEVATAEADSNARQLIAEMQGLSVDDRGRAIRDMARDRTQFYTLFYGVLSDSAHREDPVLRRGVGLYESMRMYDEVADSAGEEIAEAGPANRVRFEALTTPLTAAQKTAARNAIKPISKDEVAAAEGKTATTHSFIPGPAPGETETYKQQIEKRVPQMIDERFKSIAVGRGVAEHSDPTKLHPLSELELIARASKDETDAVFGGYVPASKKKELKADKIDASGRLVKGRIHDAWRTVDEDLKKRPANRELHAADEMFYLMQNDSGAKGIQDINYQHYAVPTFERNSSGSRTGTNPEGKIQADIGNHFAHVEQTRLDEIDRAWDAFEQAGEVNVQLFREKTPRKERKWAWTQFQTLIHEYLHTLSDGKYSTFAEDLSGEDSQEGNTLIEGVDSLLTETVWVHAKPRASLPAIREKVEPEAVKNNEPFDASLLPDFAASRYPSYANAVRLMSVVGTRNLYAAYFFGDVKLIGGPAH